MNTITSEKKEGGASETNQSQWMVINTCASGATATDLASTERTYLTVEAAITAASSNDDEIEIWRIPPAYGIARFRCIGATNNQTVTHQIYAGTLGYGNDCELAKIGQLAWTVGAQTSATSSYYLADTVTATGYCSTKTWTTATPENDLVAEASIDLQGDDLIVVVPTTCGCNAKLLLKGYQ